MSLTINPSTTLYSTTTEDKSATVKNGTIYAGPIKEEGINIPGSKLAAAQKKSMKKILDQFHSDLTLDQSLKDRAEHREELKQQIVENQKELKEIDEMVASYKEQFGITEDTPEEEYPDQYVQILSDLETRRSVYQNELDPSNPDNLYRQDKREQNMISDIKLERLKDDPMLDTQKEAAEIMSSALDATIREFMNEARKEADQRSEAAKEEANTHKSEKERQEEELLTADNEKEKKQTEIKKFIEEQHVIDEDALGIAVDQRM